MKYEPAPIPEGVSPELSEYLSDELQKLADLLNSGVSNVQLVPLAVVPERPRDGLVVLADGTNWNPGSGAGYYGYRAGVWNFLG